jgi:nucleoside-diphosphate-sugar epimerase
LECVSHISRFEIDTLEISFGFVQKTRILLIMKKIVITGSSGKAGRTVVRYFLERGYKVLGVDLSLPSNDLEPSFGENWSVIRADLTDFAQTLEVLQGADAVVHLANIPAPGIFASARTFLENNAMNYNVFSAAQMLKLERVVWASSETTLGLPFETPPRYAPVDEDHFPIPESSYALSKVVGEVMAKEFSRWSGIPFVGLRISNIMEPHDYAKFESFQADPNLRKWNLWGYVDARDVAQACCLGLEKPVTGAVNLIIAAADTVMNRPSSELMAQVFPGVRVNASLGEFETLLSIGRAREVLGYVPIYSWRDM